MRTLCRVDKPRGTRQIAAMTNPRSTYAQRLAQRLVPSGFVAVQRDGRLWLRYPDGYDSEVMPDGSLHSDDDIEATARTLETLARRRAVSLAVLSMACDLSGYDLEAGTDGVWALCQGGASSVVSVGWTLTAVLREGEPEVVLAGYLRGTGAFPVAGNTLARAFAMDRIHVCASPPMAAPRQTLPPSEQLPPVAAADDGDDAAMDAWCDRQLNRLRERLKRPWFNYIAEFGALWYRGEGDWITHEELVECAQASLQARACPGHALHCLLLLGREDYRPAALAAWDQWSGRGDGDVMGFDDLAALLYAEREDARDMIHELDNFHVRRAVRAGQFNALHMARAEFLRNLAAFRRSVGDDERWNAFLDLVQPLVREGLFLLPMFLDPDEIETLHVLTLAMARRPPAEDAWRFIHDTLSLAAPLGWKDVAECFVALPRWRNAILGDDNAPGYCDGDVTTGCLALSLVCPQIARHAIVRSAFLRYQARPGKRRRYEENADAIAVAWWRCRAAGKAAVVGAAAGL